MPLQVHSIVKDASKPGEEGALFVWRGNIFVQIARQLFNLSAARWPCWPQNLMLTHRYPLTII